MPVTTFTPKATRLKPMLAFTAIGLNKNEVGFWGASEYALPFLSFNPAFLLQADDLTLTNHSVPFNKLLLNEEGEKFLTPSLKALNYPHAIIDWPDGSVPLLTRTWWTELIDKLLELPDGSDVIFSCTGGTGRTGTMLSIAYSLLNPEEDDDPVEYIRKWYKDTAVETQEQIDYIELITNRTVEVLPSWGSGSPMNIGNGTYYYPTNVKGVVNYTKSFLQEVENNVNKKLEEDKE